MPQSLVSGWFSSLDTPEWTCVQMCAGLVITPASYILSAPVKAVMYALTPFPDFFKAWEVFLVVYHLREETIEIEGSFYDVVYVDQDWQNDMYGFLQVVNPPPPPRSSLPARLVPGYGYV